jgi:hypothetical protein
MLRSPQVTFSLFKLFAVLLLPVFLSSCAITFVKRAPKNTPFVYKTNIKVEGVRNRNETQQLETRLQNQLDDSLKVRIKSYPFWQTIIEPPKFDTTAIRRSEAYFYALLNSLGYFSATVRDTFSIDTVKRKNEQRVTINFRVNPGKELKFDSIGYALGVPDWQQLVMQHHKESLLKKMIPTANMWWEKSLIASLN